MALWKTNLGFIQAVSGACVSFHPWFMLILINCYIQGKEEIEVVMDIKGSTWMALGWRPAGKSKSTAKGWSTLIIWHWGVFDLDDGCSCDGKTPNVVSSLWQFSGPLCVACCRIWRTNASQSRCTNVSMCHFYHCRVSICRPNRKFTIIVA